MADYRVTIAKTRKGWTVLAGTEPDLREINSYISEERAILAARHIRAAAIRYDGVTRLAP